MSDQSARGADSIETKADAFADGPSTVRYYLDAIDVADEQEQPWRDEADLANKIYRCDKSEKRAFNILHSNVSVKVPAVYNSTPEPDVRPRDRSGKDSQAAEDARLGAQVIDLALRYQLDEYDFDGVARAVVRDMQIAGRGIARVAWKTYWHSDQETGEYVAWEQASCSRVPWRFFRRGPGISWDEVKWVSYEHSLTRDQVIQLAGPVIGKEINLDITEVSEKVKGGRVRELSVWQRCKVHEVWDRDTREVLFIAPGYDKAPLRREPDPYGLLDFFDCEIIQSITDPDSLNPVCPYAVYKEQAEELAVISQRILTLTGMVKFRGIRAAEIAELDDLENAEDGDFLVSQGALALVGGSKGLSDSIWIMPIEELANTIKELILQREAIKQIIYELTGISDIMRGASNPDETLGAQNIKAQAGSLRATDERKDVEKLCRNLFRKKAEIIANKFSFETLSMIVGEDLTPAVQQVLRSDVRRRYLVDIETNSTIRGDLAYNQEQMAGFMMSAGQFIQTFVPLIESNKFPPQLAQTAIVVFGAFAKSYKLGKVVDDAIATLEEAGKAFAEKASQPDPEKEARQKEQDEINRRGAEATVAKLEGQAQAEHAKAEKTKIEADKISREARMQPATDLVNVRLKAEQMKKAAEEVGAQRVETQQQEVELEHKQQRGPFMPDPTEVAKAKINADAAVQTGQSKADASVQSAREKAAAPKNDGPDFDGFVQ